MSERKSKTLFVRNLPFSATNEKLTEAFEQVGPIKTAFVVGGKEPGTCKGYGYVQFSMLEDAVKAAETVKQLEGRKISISYADAKKGQKKKPKAKNFGAAQDDQENNDEEEKNKDAEPVAKKPPPHTPKPKSPNPTPVPPKTGLMKRCRLIIRNLSFKCTVADLEKEFSKFGEISEVVIPLKNGSQSRGFAFVQFTQLDASEKAVAAMNSKQILGRPVAVDWAIAKDRYEASTKKKEPDNDSGVSEEESEEEEEKEEESDEEDEHEEMDSDKEDDDDEDESDEDEDEHEEMDSDKEDDDDEDESDEDGDESDEDGDDSDDGEETDDESDEEDAQSKPDKKPAFERKSDVEEGRTLFIRNLPFEAPEEEVEEMFGEFGDLTYVRLVMDKFTGRPRGTGFVQFKTKKAADECLAKAQGRDRDGGLVIQGRPLLVAPAVSRTEANTQQVAKKTKEEKDGRNLFLAREGLIRAGTQSAAGISSEDMQKRMKVEQQKREKLKNQNIFVSSTRLCIHNLAPKVSENELKKVMKETVDDSTAKITECRVMRNMDRTNQKGVSKSMGFAFVNFSTHEHALKALRGLNNSTVFGDNKRPIVEFSLENRKALEAKEKRLEKSKAGVIKRKAEDAEQAAAGPPKKQPKPAPNKKKDRTQDKIAKSLHSGPKGLPKRMGPKIRHRNRGTGKGENPNAARKAKRAMKYPNKPQPKEPQAKMMKNKNKKRAEVTDKTDKLINKHKAKRARIFYPAP